MSIHAGACQLELEAAIILYILVEGFTLIWTVIERVSLEIVVVKAVNMVYRYLKISSYSPCFLLCCSSIVRSFSDMGRARLGIRLKVVSTSSLSLYFNRICLLRTGLWQQHSSKFHARFEHQDCLRQLPQRVYPLHRNTSWARTNCGGCRP